MFEMMEHAQDIKLLYVEDDEDTKKATISVLEELFENIIIAKNGQDGLNKFKNNDIDLILTDIGMPKFNGLEMTEKIREIDKDIPILVISAYNESSYLNESIKVGVDDYIFKPIDMDHFIRVVSKVVQKIKLKDKVN